MTGANPLAWASMRPDDLSLLHVPAAPTLHPDGDRAVVSVLRPSFDDDEYVGGLWSVPLDGAGPRRITRGHRDTEPRFSPDGRLLGFLRAEKGGKSQLHVVAATGGEPVALTDAPLGVGAPTWAPDSRRLAYVARVPEEGRYGTDEDVKADAEPPRHITTLRYRFDGVGFTNDRRQHVFVVDVPDLDDADTDGAEASEPQARQVTAGDYDHTAVAWSPDGSLLAIVAARHERRDRDLRSDLHVCAPDGSGWRTVTRTTLGHSPQVEFSPDGQTLWFLAGDLGADGVDFVAANTGLFSVPVDGAQPPVRHSDAETVDLGEVGSHLSVAAQGVLVQDRTRGAVHLLRVPLDGGVTEVLLDGDLQVRGHAATPDGRLVVATVATPDSVGDVILLGAGAVRRLTDFSAPLRDTGRTFPVREVTVKAEDGYPVHGWVVLPQGEGPHPVLLTVHGGPYGQYGWGLFDEAQVCAGAGYAVLMCNPRGSAGYGQGHGRAVRHAFGDRDVVDVLAFLDGALADPELGLDAERVGVQGGSYGGWMSAWLTAHTDRFAAAIVERGFLDPLSFLGSADIGWFFIDQYCGTDPERVREQAPMTYVDQVRTPTLVVHSEQDWRCPVEQAQRWYVALKRRGVEAELLLFPGEGHELSRSGRPRHRRQRFEHVLRWWARHLPTTS
jgi:dipeptidyl aminopeptidase/acylaminoacyl peptidase